MGNLYGSASFMEHNTHPDYKYEMDAPTHTHDGINPSCGDELTLSLRVENVEPTKHRATLVLNKAADHTVESVLLRKL